VGTQSRRVNCAPAAAQKEPAPAAVRARDQSGAHQRPVVTAVEPAGTFWPAEEYHQQYLVKKGLATCRI
jgi:peptide-methionine (S)-S-oxide reductase